jgi:site-specific recombinase XerD
MPKFFQYYPAVLKKAPSIGYYIEYYAIDGTTNELRRQIVKLNRLKKRYNSSQFRLQASLLVQEINTKLAGGWSPFLETSNARFYTPLLPLLDEYLKEKQKDLRPASLANYKSFCTVFGQWIKDNAPTVRSGNFTKVYAAKYLDDFYKKKIVARTYNNQLKQCRAFFLWLVEKCYAKENPFTNFKTKRTDQKRRILIPENTRKEICEWCLTNNPNYLIVQQLVFNSLIRPKEISELRMKDLNLEEKYILVLSEVAKTHNARYASLSDELIKLLSAPQFQKAKPNDYILGTGYVPNTIKMPKDRFHKDWDKMRKVLDLPEEMQLYSLRDTGINTLLKSGVDPLTVMQHADHHDLSITTRYANHADPNLIKHINENVPDF